MEMEDAKVSSLRMSLTYTRESFEELRDLITGQVASLIPDDVTQQLLGICEGNIRAIAHKEMAFDNQRSEIAKRQRSAHTAP